MPRRLNEYVAYKGEDFLAAGTVPELAQELGVKVETVRFMSHPAHKKRDKGNRIVIYKLEED